MFPSGIFHFDVRMIQVRPIAEHFIDLAEIPDQQIELMRRLVHEHAAAFVLPTAAPRIAQVIRFVAPAEHRDDAQHGFADLALIDRAADTLAGRIKTALANGAENGFMRTRRREHGVAIRQGRRERFLDDGVDAGLGGSDRGRGVLGVRRADANGFSPASGKHFRHVGERGHVIFIGEAFCFLRGARANGDEFGFREALQRGGVQVADFSATDQGCFNFSHNESPQRYGEGNL
jgi:hypothetical protein